MAWNNTVLGLALAALMGVGCQQAPAAQEQVSGQRMYDNYCTPCHNADGSGNQGVGAPNVAGLPQWYVQRQLDGFREGHRGTHFDDVMGMKMRPMALTLPSEAAVAATAEYVAAMPVIEPEPTLEGGDAEAGKALYGTCTACHGPEARGMEAVGGPPLHHADDWYMFLQLQKFKSGVRGTKPGDTWGAQMRPMAATLQDEQAMKDVIAYIQTL